jgi:subtilisin family serine protease
LIDVNSPNATTGYIVTYKKLAGINTSAAGAKMMSASQVKVTAQKMAGSYGASVKQTYSSAISGFAMQIPNKNINKFLADAAKNPMVARIEKDIPVVLDALTTQTPATWGLDRSDQKKLPLNNTYNYTGDGSGVTAYVVDSGINPTHQEFAGRINPGFTSISDGRGTTDCKGHGSHVAGIIGGTKYGVAKKIRITPIRIFDCNGGASLSGIIAGVDWIVKNGKRPGVINLSLGASPSNTFDAAVTAAHNAGFVVVASAGNFAGEACNQSPARAHKVITVASTDINDKKSYYSNYGQCIDLFAPGANIQSAWFNSAKSTNEISGTSMSAPHVAGVAALYLQMKPTATPDQINYALLNSATASVVGTIGKDTPNRLLNITNKLNFTPVVQPIYVPPIVSPLPPPSPVPGPKPPTPIKAFRKISIEKIQFGIFKSN